MAKVDLGQSGARVRSWSTISGWPCATGRTTQQERSRVCSILVHDPNHNACTRPDSILRSGVERRKVDAGLERCPTPAPRKPGRVVTLLVFPRVQTRAPEASQREDPALTTCTPITSTQVDMLSQLSRAVPRHAALKQARFASSKPATTKGVAIWERQQLYGRQPHAFSDAMHGTGHHSGEVVQAGAQYGGILTFIGAIGGALFGGLFLMESCRKAE